MVNWACIIVGLILLGISYYIYTNVFFLTAIFILPVIAITGFILLVIGLVKKT